MLLLAGLIHPNLPRIYDYFVENQRWYFVMDFLAGETLEAYLSKRKNRPLAIEEVLDSGIQLATVLDYLHLHKSPLGFKDLTLSTIWRTPDGKLYLLDTGTAPPAAAMPASRSIYILGKILRQLQAGNICTYYTGSGVLGLAWSPNGMRLAMGNRNGQVQAFDANTGLHVMTFQAPDLWQRVEDVIWLPDGKTIAAGGDDAIVWIWNAATGKLQHTYRGHTKMVITLACSPDGKYIASGGQDTTVQGWEVATWRKVLNYSGHASDIGSVAWSPDGNYIASASFDTTVQILEAATGRPIYTYHGHINPVDTVAWSPDGGRIASGDAGGTVLVWPVALFEGHGQQYILTYFQRNNNPNTAPNNAVQAGTRSPDSRYLASVSYDVEIWNSFNVLPIYTYTKHAPSIVTAVHAAALFPQNRV